MSTFLKKLKSFMKSLFSANTNQTLRTKTNGFLSIRPTKSCHFKNDQQFMQYAYTAPYKYKSYFISKRNSKKKRLIAQPTTQLKNLQTEILQQISYKLPIHNAAYAYVKNRSIKDNALLHRNSNYILKLDFKDFFNSIRPQILIDQLKKHQLNFTDLDYDLMSFLFFWREKQNSPLKLSVGAPSSPLLSNFVMYHFDEQLSQICQHHHCTYSRYADDITISSKFNFYDSNFPMLIQNILKEEFQGKIKLNTAKTKYFTRAHHRYVTGITITNDAKISVGNVQKRLLSSKIHHFKIKKLTDQRAILSLKGQLSFSFYIYPELKMQFIKKYGEDTINQIMKFQMGT